MVNVPQVTLSNSTINQSKDTDTVIQEINERFDKIMIQDCYGNFRARVCVVCDEILTHEQCKTVTLKEIERNRNLLSENSWNRLDVARKEQYSIVSSDVEVQATTFGLILSPRATEIERDRNGSNNQTTKCFTSCRKCKYHLSRKQMPPFAIANNFAVGTPPECLTELNHVELALLTPVKTFGYCLIHQLINNVCNNKWSENFLTLVVEIVEISSPSTPGSLLFVHPRTLLVYSRTLPSVPSAVFVVDSDRE